MFGAMDLGIADDGERTGHERATQIAIALFADLPSLYLPQVQPPFGGSHPSQEEEG
jgi:hypothetical protein